MAKHIHHGWSTSLDDIPEPYGIIFGRNLRASSDDAKKPPTEPEQKQPSERTSGYRVLTPEEARERGIPTSNHLIIHPAPRKR